MKTLLDILKNQESIASTQVERNRISELKTQLNATDYKVIKNAECIAAGFEPAYDPVQLHTERQALRDEINALESEINV